MAEIDHDKVSIRSKRISELHIRKEIPFASKKITRELYRLIILFLLLIFIIFYFVNPNFYNEGSVGNLILIITFFTFFLFLVLYKFTKNINLEIQFFEDRYTYPYLFFWKKSVDFRSVFSNERTIFRGKCVSFLIGEVSGNAFFIAKQRFENEADFYAFGKAMDELVEINLSAGVKTRHIFVNERKKQNLVLQILVVFLWAAVLACLSLSSNIEYFQALELGALTKNVKGGEDVYRVASSFFLHVNLFHLLSNMLVFAIMAESLLRLLDVYRFLTVLLLSAFCASSVSLYLAPYEFVIGASGGVFGLFGAFCVVKFTKDLPGTVSLRSNKMVLLVIVIQVVSGYFIDGVDYFSHGGGFVLGAVIMALYLYFAPTPSIFQSTRVEKALAVMLSSFYFWGLGMFLFQVNA